MVRSIHYNEINYSSGNRCLQLHSFLEAVDPKIGYAVIWQSFLLRTVASEPADDPSNETLNIYKFISAGRASFDATDLEPATMELPILCGEKEVLGESMAFREQWSCNVRGRIDGVFRKYAVRIVAFYIFVIAVETESNVICYCIVLVENRQIDLINLIFKFTNTVPTKLYYQSHLQQFNYA